MECPVTSTQVLMNEMSFHLCRVALVKKCLHAEFCIGLKVLKSFNILSKTFSTPFWSNFVS